jgi:multiple sugar transport system substrate-binding protein
MSGISREDPSDLEGKDRMPTKRLSRRAFFQLAGAATAVTALAGCSPFSAGSATGARVDLVYQDWRTDWFPPMATKMLDQFNSSHPNVQVTYRQDPETVEDTMIDDMKKGTAPDVFQGCCTHFPIWAQNGYVLDLRKYVEADLDRATIEDWDQAQYKSFLLKDGRQFGLPKYHGALALYYNRDLFDKYGVDYPDRTWSHDDYQTAMTKLTHRGSAASDSDVWGSMLDVSWDRLQVHVNGWGGHFVDPADPKRCLMSSTASLAAMEWVRARMWDDRVMASTIDVKQPGPREAFVAGQVAMCEDGSWALKDILAQAKFRLGVAPFPAGPVQRATLSTTDGFGIYAGTKNPDAAWELLKFLISPEYGRAMAQANLLQPARASLVDEWVRLVHEEFPLPANGVDVGVFADGQIEGYSVTAEIFANMAQAKQLTYDAWQKIFTNGEAPVDLMKSVCQQVESSQQTASAQVSACAEEGCGGPL